MRDGDELTLQKLAGGEYGDLPEYIAGADAEEAARLLRAAARELLEFRFPALALKALWQQATDPATSREMRRNLLRQIGRRIERLATIGLGQHDEAVVRQVAGLTFEGPQAVLRLDGAGQTTTPGARNARGLRTA
ncbi:MAG TPA: hypothetical protein PLG21_21865 [Anaerolineae bacterium]|nr:hypothetical protein [Anaerolineae bacterium]